MNLPPSTPPGARGRVLSRGSGKEVAADRLARREFLAALARAGAGSAALTALPAWAKQALAAAAPAPVAELIVRNDWPEHWETAIHALGGSWLTPNERFFVRSHFPVPEIDPVTWRLEVSGLVRQPLTFTLEEFGNLPKTDATYVLECAGNGRGLMRLPNTSGTQWGRGAVGNARWRGVPLADLLRRAEPSADARHVWFEAADQAPVPGPPPFLRSLPIEKAMDDVLLADRMNGAPLPRLHGAPLRAIVPGWFGMASTKWLTRVRVEAEPSDNHFMVRGYRYVVPGGDPATSSPVEEIRVKSVITRPLEGTRVKLTGPKPPFTRIQVRGIAWAGPAGLKLVEVSIDDGATWRPAGFTGESEPMSWRMWATEVEAKGLRKVTICARATDLAGNQQPQAAEINGAGYGNNSIHKVTVSVSP
ncbi:MAG TPA: sulfite oxidase [Candidatus Eisenbacteria bacterium]|jgi:DMSO/TMAO reductase YedYZ molybdopterin-dependent catalytic subunit